MGWNKLFRRHCMIRIIPIASGSGGNCLYADLDGKRLLIDLGASARAVTAALRANSLTWSDIDLLLLTHTHTDHTKGMDGCLKKTAAPLYMSSASKATLVCARAQELPYNIRTELLPGLRVTAFRTSHDCIGSVGYLLETEHTRFGYATDLGVLTEEIKSLLAGADCIVLESNHDTDMLRQGPYPVSLKRRILSENGHLSNEDCCEGLRCFAAAGTKHFLLAHLSRENNTPDLALAYAEMTLAGTGADVSALPVSGSEMITFD